jgi:hypothetical protein
MLTDKRLSDLLMATEPDVAKIITDEIAALRAEVAGLRSDRKVLRDALSLAECVYRRSVVGEGEPSSILDAMQQALAAAP